MMKRKYVLIVGFLVSLSASGAPGFTVKPTGQATGSSCQSYALGVALAFKRDPAFNLDTATELRTAEQAIRSEIKKIAGSADVNHAHVKQGFENFTNGKYKLIFKDINLTEIGSFASKRSGVYSEAATPPNFLMGETIKEVILASATKIDNDDYLSGHIFTILGSDGQPNSNQKFLILNSAIKVKNLEQNTCQDGVPDDPGSYTAELSWKNNNAINFKLNEEGKIRIWEIEKN